MSEGIPAHIDLLRAARSDSQFDGTVKLADMPRLVGMLASKDGLLNVKVKLGLDEQGYAYLHGTASGEAQVYCQRCLQAMPLELEADFELTLVESEYEVERIPEEKDVLVITEVPGSLVNIIEDELILAFPLVQMHEAENCDATGFMKDERKSPDEQASQEKENPFGVLKDFKLDG